MITIKVYSYHKNLSFKIFSLLKKVKMFFLLNGPPLRGEPFNIKRHFHFFSKLKILKFKIFVSAIPSRPAPAPALPSTPSERECYAESFALTKRK